MARRLKDRAGRDGINVDAALRGPSPYVAPSSAHQARSERSRRYCHTPAETKKPNYAPPRDSGAYVPEMAASVDNDRNLTDGARRCARKLMEYVYRRNREDRAAEITVTWLMNALGKSRRTVQRHLRELEREGYIAVDVLRAGTRMCVGLFIELLAPLFPRHRREKWPDKSMKSDAPKVSQNYKFRYKTERIPRALWFLRCADPIWRAWQRTLPPLSPFPGTV
jgi:DNA-binding transcriptional ArsR family regulator